VPPPTTGALRPKVYISARVDSDRERVAGVLSAVVNLVSGHADLVENFGVLVVVVRDLREADAKDWAISEIARARGRPTVLVTSSEPRSLLQLHRLPCDEVVALEDIDRVLLRVILDRSDPGLTEAMARVVDTIMVLDPVVRHAIGHMLRSERPPNTVNALVRSLPVGLSAFGDRWRASDLTVRPYTWLRMVALARAEIAWRVSRSIQDVEERVGWRRNRLDAAARELFDLSLGEFLATEALGQLSLQDAVANLLTRQRSGVRQDPD